MWGDICALLADPARVEQEYQRRAAGEEAEGAAAEGEALAKRVAAVQRGISRLIDSYSEGLLEKEEFEPRLRAARARLARLEAEAQAQADAAARQAELRLVLGKFQEFADSLQTGLKEASWTTRREVIRAVVKQVEIGDEDVRIVYRVPPVPFVERPEGGGLQHCGRRRVPFFLPFFLLSPGSSPPTAALRQASEPSVRTVRTGYRRVEGQRQIGVAPAAWNCSLETKGCRLSQPGKRLHPTTNPPDAADSFHEGAAAEPVVGLPQGRFKIRATFPYAGAAPGRSSSEASV